MKRARAPQNAHARPIRRPLLSELTFAILCAFAAGAAANPNGANVVSGQASVAASGKTLVVTNTPGTIINWQGFSIAADELTRFIQQSPRSSVLNRVVGQDPSSLLGQLQSNGRVYLINPNGIVFGVGARVDVGALVASTLDWSDADFLAGRLRFGGAPGAGSLRQLGAITTPSGGQVILIAPRVENSGVITTPQGELVLAAGHSVQLADTANPDLRVTVEAAPGEVLNLGRLIAEGGRIGIHAGLIRNAGSITTASRAESGPGGEIYLRATGAIALDPSSRISADGAAGGRITVDGSRVEAAGTLTAVGAVDNGGVVRLLGEHVVVPDAAIDASGGRGGGEILVGGDLHGAAAGLRNARTTDVGAAAQLRADAREQGSGGKVVVWSDEATTFAGTISARGGAAGGGGGFVEVSGKQTLAFDGNVDTTALHGPTGTLLLDPSDITISSAANASISAGPTFTGSAASSTLNVTTLQTALATNNVIVDTTSAFASAGNISVANAVTWASANTLELRAHNDITVAAAATINASGSGALRLIADQDASGSGNVSINAALTAHSGGIAISGVGVSSIAAGSLTTTGLASADAGAVSIAATGAVNLGGAVVATGGAAGAATAGRAGGAVAISGTTVATAAVTASGSAGNGVNQAGGNAGTISITASGTLTSGAIAAATGAATGTGAGGAAGSVTLQGTAVTATSLTTTGGANGAGGTISATATSGLLNVSGAIASTGGTANASSAGSSAGNIALSGVGVTTTTINADGSAGTTALSNRPGGAGGIVQITSTNGVSTTTIGASGGAATTTNANGGNAGSISIANSGAGNVTTTALTASTGAATGTGTGGAVGTGISVVNTAGNIQTTSISTAGGASGSGGNVVLNAAGAVTTTAGSTIVTSGGAPAAGASMQGTDAGNVTIGGASVTMTMASALNMISAIGGNAQTLASARGGHAGAISVSATGGAVNFTNGILNATGGNAVAGVGAGGDAKNITINATGDVTVNAINVRSGSAFGSAGSAGAAAALGVSGANVGLGAITTTGGNDGDAGTVTVNASGTLTTGAITANGGAGNADTAGGKAGAVALTSSGAGVTTGAINVLGGSGGAGAGAAGGHGASITLSSNGTISAGALQAEGGAAGGTTAAGGNAGSVLVTNNSAVGGTITTGTLTSRPGASTGTALIGADVGSVTVTNNAAALLQTAGILTSGRANGAGANVTLTSAGNVTVTSTISSSGGALNAGTGGAAPNAGNVTIKGVNRSIAGAITASGGAAAVAGNAGGNAGAVLLTGSGGTAATAGILSTAGITASNGASSGTVASGTPGSIRLEGTSVTATTLTTTGGGNGAGGAIVATASSGLLNVSGAITSSGGTANASSPGTDAGSVTLSGVNVTTVGITANGANGNGNDFAGGNGAIVSVTGTGGTVSIGAVSTAAGNGVAGNAAGGNAGAITLDAGGVTPTITFTGSLTATGGNRTGTGTPGAGGQIWFKDAALIGAGPLTLAAGGGSAGVGTGGNVRFDGTVDSSGGARALTVNTNGATILNGALGAGSALLSLTTDATGTTQLNSGTVTTTGAQAFGDAVTLGGNTTLDAGAGAITFSSTVNGAFALTANSGAITTFSGAVGAVTPLASLTTNAGGSTTIGGGAITTGGNQTYNDAVNYSAGTVLTATAGTVVSGGAFTASAPAGSLTLTVDPTKDVSLVNPANDFATVTVTSARNVALRDANAIALGASTLSGTLDVTAGGAITQTGALTVSGAASFSTGAAAVTLNNAGNDFMATVSVTNTGGNVAITDVNDLQLNAIGMASAANTLTVVSNGAITQAGASTITTGTGAVSFNSGAGGSPITLTNDNDFRGAVSLTNAGANDVAIKDVNALTFGAGAVARHLQANSTGAMAFNGVLSVAGNLQADSGGNPVTEGAAAALTVTGTTLLTAGAANNITLNTAGNNFGGEVRIVSGNTVNLRDANTIAFGNGGTSTISGNLTVTSAGAITQTQPLNVTGTATFAPGAGNNVTLLDAANDFGGIAFTSGTTATMRDVNGVIFGTTNVTTLDINAGGTVTQSGVVSATTLTADLTGATSALNFNTSSNGVTNLAVSGGKGITAPGGFRLTNGAGITGQGIVTTTNAPIYVSANGLFQNAGTSAFVAGSGDITVISSTLAINSTAAPGSFQTSGTLLMRPITAAADMSFAGAVATYNLVPVEVARVVGGVTGTVTFGEQGFSTGILTIAGALNFGNITANLNAGSITDGGTVRTVTARDLNLNAATGTIGSAVANGAIDVAVTNLTLNTVNQNASVTSASGYNLGFGSIESNVGAGTLSTNVSAGGSITQTTKVTAGTLTALLAGASGAVNLDTVDNNISTIGAVTALQGFRLTNGNNPTTVTASLATNGPVSISTGTGAFSQNNFDISAGSGPITITADSINIAANTGSNAMQTTGALTLKPFSAGTNMSLAGASAFDLTAAEITDIAGGVGAAGSIVIGAAAASTGAMTIGGAVNFGVKTVTLNAGTFTDGNTVSQVSARDLNLNARTGAIGAAGANNAIDVNTTNLTFNTTNQDAFVNASGAVNLGSGTSATGSGNLDLTAGGAITQSAGGTLTSSGATTLAAGAANDITLNAANNFGTVVITSGRNVTLNDTNALNLGASTISGNLQVTTAGALTQSGAIVANGAGKTATFAAGAGNDITLAGANDFTSVTVNSARNATIHDSSALALGASTVTGAFVATAGGNVTLNGAINAGGAGDAIVLAAAGNFVNNAGAAALVPGSGRWLVYSTDPAADTRGGLVYDFKQYNATYGVTPVLGTGNGMLYSLAPTLAVSLTGTVGKVYDGTTVATLGPANYSFSGTVDADTATINNPAVGTYATRNVGSGINASVAGVAVTSGTNAGRPVYGYQPTSSTINADIGNITAAPLTVTAQTDSRVYDSSSASTVAPVVTGTLYDAVGTAAIQTFDTKNVGVGKTLTATGLIVNDGNGGNNYAISYVADSTGVITPAGLTVTGVTANNKVYDATAMATLNTGGAGLGGAFAGDTVTLNTGASSATFADKNVGLAKPVTAIGFTTGGADAANYTLAQPAGLAADITRAPLAISGVTASNKVYDATTAATLVTSSASVAPLGTDVITLSVAGGAGTFADKNVGIGKAVTASGFTISGVDAGNYTPTQPAGLAADITPAMLAVSGVTANSKVYDATTAASLIIAGASIAPLGTDVVNLSVGGSAGAFADKNAGVGKAVTASGFTISGVDAGNYTLVQPAGLAADITPTMLAISGVTATGKVYDATPAATLATGGASVAPLATDVVNLSAVGSVGAFADKNVGTAKAVTASGFTISGADAGNYALVQPAGLAADITRAALAVNGVTANNKVYDATTAATLATGGASVAPLATDVVNLSAVGSVGAFADKNVGTAKAVTASGFTISGADAGNYTLVQPAGLAADITPAMLAVSGVTANGKVYDATTAATLVTTTAGVAPFTGDSVALASGGASAAFADKNAGVGKTVTVSGFTISGTDAGNYTLAQPAGLTADITRAPLAVGGVVANAKVYDATTSVALATAGASVAPLGTDSVALDVAGATAAFADRNVGAAKAVTVSGFTISGSDAANYTLVQPVGLAADISARAITITAGSNAPGSRLYGAATNPVVGYAVGGSGMAGGEDAQALLGFGIGSLAGPATPVGVYATGGEQYRIIGLAPGTFGNYRITALGDGILTISPALPGNVLDELNRSFFGALERNLPVRFGIPADCVRPKTAPSPGLENDDPGSFSPGCGAGRAAGEARSSPARIETAVRSAVRH